jgi:hypothetical protein
MGVLTYLKSDCFIWTLFVATLAGWLCFAPNEDIKAYGTFHHNQTHPLRVDGNVIHYGEGYVRRDLFFPCSSVYKPIKNKQEQPVPKSRTGGSGPAFGHHFKPSDPSPHTSSAAFPGGGGEKGEDRPRSLKCHAWYFRPENTEGQKLPLVVMGSGLGAQIDFGMDLYAIELAMRVNTSVLLFEYRGFGSSEGHPRNLIDPTKHLEDWRSALKFVSDHRAHETGYPVADEVRRLLIHDFIIFQTRKSSRLNP